MIMKCFNKDSFIHKFVTVAISVIAIVMFVSACNRDTSISVIGTSESISSEIIADNFRSIESEDIAATTTYSVYGQENPDLLPGKEVYYDPSRGALRYDEETGRMELYSYGNVDYLTLPSGTSFVGDSQYLLTFYNKASQTAYIVDNSDYLEVEKEIGNVDSVDPNYLAFQDSSTTFPRLNMADGSIYVYCKRDLYDYMLYNHGFGKLQDEVSQIITNTSYID